MNEIQDKEIIPAKTKKVRTYKSPSDPSNFKTKPGEISKMINSNIKYFDMERVKSDDELHDRIIMYFQGCADDDVKPSVSGLALAVGYDRTTLHDWEVGRNHGFSPLTSDIIKKAKIVMLAMTEQMAQDEKVNPAIAIFLLKNHFGYKDVNDVVLSPGMREQPIAAIEAKYEEIPDED